MYVMHFIDQSFGVVCSSSGTVEFDPFIFQSEKVVYKLVPVELIRKETV